ncbi:MAG: TIGR02281 family clan AA aspartic protease [Gallionella sp.]
MAANTMKILICLFVLISNIATAAIYKCEGSGNTVYSAEPCSNDAQDISEKMAKPNLMLGSSQPDQQQTGPKTMTLTLTRTGIYTVAGSVKDVPVIFQVDTGASMVAVSKRITDEAGIYSCIRYQNTSTANGIVRQCVAKVSEITFGVFRMKNIEVAIVENMSVDALLGMTVLRTLKIHQERGVMRLSN